eukprot:14288999-Alexandrium_andersonii.AAC.1
MDALEAREVRVGSRRWRSCRPNHKSTKRERGVGPSMCSLRAPARPPAHRLDERGLGLVRRTAPARPLPPPD